LFMGLVFFWCRDLIKVSENNLKYTLIILAITTFCIKTSLFPMVIREHTSITNFGPIAIKKVEELKCECSEIDKLAKAHKVEMIVFVPNWRINVPGLEFYNYGCPLLDKHFTPSVMNVYERRTWVFTKEGLRVAKNIMIYGYEADKENIKTIINSGVISIGDITIIKGNIMSTESLLKQLHIDYKRN